MTLHGGHGPMRLIDLDTVLPDPWRTARAEDERKRRDQHQHDPAPPLPDQEPDDPAWPYER